MNEDYHSNEKETPQIQTNSISDKLSDGANRTFEPMPNISETERKVTEMEELRAQNHQLAEELEDY